jgi:hypothetical protein
MKVFGLTLRFAGATLMLLALQTLWGHLWIATPFTREVGLPALSGILVVLALSLVAASSSQQGWTLSGTLFVLYFGINCLNSLDETFLYKIGIKAYEMFRLIGSGFCTALIFAPLLVLILGCWNTDEQEAAEAVVPRSAANWVTRIAIGVLLYVLCYYVTGMAAHPFVKDFSAGFKLPDTAGMLGMEFLRGIVYVAAGLAVTSGMKGKRSRAAATLSLAFPILAGVAPLLVHNPYLPDYIRLAHGFEIGTSNLAYGALLGHILTLKAAPAIAAPPAENAESLP